MLIVAQLNAQCIVTQTGTLLSIRNLTLLVTRVEWLFFFLLLSLLIPFGTCVVCYHVLPIPNRKKQHIKKNKLDDRCYFRHWIVLISQKCVHLMHFDHKTKHLQFHFHNLFADKIFSSTARISAILSIDMKEFIESKIQFHKMLSDS